MKILGFGHRKRVGKDKATAFAIGFARQYRPDLNIQLLSFGNIIKEHSQNLFGWAGLQDAPYYENNPDKIEISLPAIGKSPRQIWDHIGLMGRELSDRVWVELALHEIDADLLICKDIRGLTEFDLINRVGGLAIKINRPDVPIGGPVDEILKDANWPRTIENNSTLRDLCTQVKLVTQECIDSWFPKI